MGKHRLLIRDASAGQVSNTGSELTCLLDGSQANNQMVPTLKKMELKDIPFIKNWGRKKIEMFDTRVSYMDNSGSDS
jgi:hypothetical protein